MADELRCMSRPCDGRCFTMSSSHGWLKAMFQNDANNLVDSCILEFRLGSHGRVNALERIFGSSSGPALGSQGSYLVDPASSHMLVSKIKPCMSKYILLIL